MSPRSSTPGAAPTAAPIVDLHQVVKLFAELLAPAVAEQLAALQPSGPAAAEAWVDRREIARLHGISIAKVDRLCNQGMPFVVVGDVRRFDVAAVRAWFASRPSVTEAPASSPRTVPAANDDEAPVKASGVRCLSRPRRAAGGGQ